MRDCRCPFLPRKVRPDYDEDLSMRTRSKNLWPGKFLWRPNILILSMRVKKDSPACVFFYRQSLRNHSKPGKRKPAACCIEHSSINAATLPIIRTQPTRPCPPLSSFNLAVPANNMAGSAVVSPACSAGRNPKAMNTASLAMKSLIWCRCGTWPKSATNCQWPLTTPA